MDNHQSNLRPANLISSYQGWQIMQISILALPILPLRPFWALLFARMCLLKLFPPSSIATTQQPRLMQWVPFILQLKKKINIFHRFALQLLWPRWPTSRQLSTNNCHKPGFQFIRSDIYLDGYRILADLLPLHCINARLDICPKKICDAVFETYNGYFATFANLQQKCVDT